MDSMLRSELVKKSIKEVFSLPSLKLTKLKAGSPRQSSQSQDFYQQTVNACLNMLTSLLSEAPSLEALQDILVLRRWRHNNRKGKVVKWVREDFFIPGPAIFYTDISKISKMAKLPIVVKEIHNQLHRISDTRTKDETLTAVVNLAVKRLNPVVDTLLDCSLECDESAAAIWKALVSNPYSSSKLLRPLLKRLQDEDPNAEVTYRRRSTSQMPMAATNALCLILSLPEASDVLQNKFPQLLLALITQIYFLFGTSRRVSRAASLMPEPPSHLHPLA
ncbi:maestro heat-like repeat-containing protein family member 9 isoform X2 [Podarcis muralis]